MHEGKERDEERERTHHINPQRKDQTQHHLLFQRCLQLPKQRKRYKQHPHIRTQIPNRLINRVMLESSTLWVRRGHSPVSIKGPAESEETDFGGEETDDDVDREEDDEAVVFCGVCETRVED